MLSDRPLPLLSDGQSYTAKHLVFASRFAKAVSLLLNSEIQSSLPRLRQLGFCRKVLSIQLTKVASKSPKEILSRLRRVFTVIEAALAFVFRYFQRRDIFTPDLNSWKCECHSYLRKLEKSLSRDNRRSIFDGGFRHFERVSLHFIIREYWSLEAMIDDIFKNSSQRSD